MKRAFTSDFLREKGNERKMGESFGLSLILVVTDDFGILRQRDMNFNCYLEEGNHSSQSELPCPSSQETPASFKSGQRFQEWAEGSDALWKQGTSLRR